MWITISGYNLKDSDHSFTISPIPCATSAVSSLAPHCFAWNFCNMVSIIKQRQTKNGVIHKTMANQKTMLHALNDTATMPSFKWPSAILWTILHSVVCQCFMNSTAQYVTIHAAHSRCWTSGIQGLLDLRLTISPRSWHWQWQTTGHINA